jgi:hypothetical protein
MGSWRCEDEGFHVAQYICVLAMREQSSVSQLFDDVLNIVLVSPLSLPQSPRYVLVDNIVT